MGAGYLQPRLDVADVFTAKIRCADFHIGHSSRKGGTGRALVDATTELHVNYAGDWTKTVIGGQVTTPSSRAIKENISDLSRQEAFTILEGLNPVKFNLKTDASKLLHLGFISEDAPDMVASEDRQAITQAHIIAALTRVVKEQHVALASLSERVDQLDARR